MNKAENPLDAYPDRDRESEHHRRHHHHKKKAPPSAPRLKVGYCYREFSYSNTTGEISMSNTTVTVTLPTTRTDGKALDLSEIASVVLTKAAGAEVPAVAMTFNAPFSDPTVSFNDTAPDMGQTDNYSATVTDIEGNVSAAASASVTIPPSKLAAPAAPTLTATFIA